MELNFGHTLGHAIEKTAGYGVYLHGEGVAMGMAAACRWGEALGITPAGTGRELEGIMARLGLPTRTPADLEAGELFAAMAGDKKRAGAKSAWCCCAPWGTPAFTPWSCGILRNFSGGAYEPNAYQAPAPVGQGCHTALQERRAPYGHLRRTGGPRLPGL